MELSDKVALITGAAKRVGRAIAVDLSNIGCSISVHYHSSASEAESLSAEIRAVGGRAALVQGDLADPATPDRLVEQTVERLGRLDVLVNNASAFAPSDLADWTGERWAEMFRVNLFAPAMLAHSAVPHMRRSGTGRIINLTDILADRPIRGYAAYCASKAALASLTRSLARELAPDITVNAISPGIAVFPEDYDESLRDTLVRRVPLGRAGSPEEVAAAVRFLLTAGDYITGQILAIDGGRSIVP